MDKNIDQIIEENFAFIDRVLERDLGINLHPEEPVYETTETMEELSAWIDEQVHGPIEEKWNDVSAEGVQLIPMEAVRSMVESGEIELEEDGDGFEEDIANRIQDELFDYLDECGYFIANKDGNEEEITRYTLNNWYSLRPDEFKYYGGGMEWDYVTYAENYLRRNYPRIKLHTFLLLHIDEDGPTSYPFLIYQVGTKWYYHECAIPERRRSEIFETSAQAVEKITNDWKESNGGYTDGITVISRYHPYDHHDEHLDELYQSVFEDYRNWIKKYESDILTESKGKHKDYLKRREDYRREQRYRKSPHQSYNPEVMLEADTQQVNKPSESTGKNGVNRKNLYIAFIQYAERVDSANKFDTNFTKDIFDTKYKNVPESMRYFYRLADPTQCILNDGLVFFSLKNAQEINKKNSDITKYYIFAGIGDLFFVVDQKNGAVHEATEEQLRHVRVGKKLAPNFDIYVQKLVNKGDYLDGKIIPPDDRPKKETKDA